MLPVVFALCSGSNPSSRSDGDGRSWDGAGLGLFSPKLGRVEFWAGAVGGKGHGGPKFLGRCRGGARAIAAVTSLLLKFWDQIPTGIQIPGGDSSPLGVPASAGFFPLVPGWVWCFFGPWKGLEHPNTVPPSGWIRVPSLGLLGSLSHFSYNSMGSGDPSYPPPARFRVYPTAGSSEGAQIP